MKHLNSLLMVGAMLCFNTGCQVTPPYHRPQALPAYPWKNKADDAVTANAIPVDWWRYYGSAELSRLMMQALNNNQDLAAAKARILQARGLAKQAGAPLLPAISASGNYNFQDGNQRSSTNINNSKNSWTGQWGISYEVDLWGGIRAGRDSAVSQYNSARFTTDALRLVVMSDVAQTYFTTVGLKERKQVALENLTNITEVMAIINSRFEVGAVSKLEVAQQQTELANAAANVAQLDQQIAQSENALAVLLGLPPQRFKVNVISLRDVAIPKPHNPDASKLLDRRPDIKAAEADLISAQADIGKARAAFYPRLQLGADNLFTAATASHPASVAVALAAALSAPIFQGGRLEGELERTLARRTELLETYRKTILTTYREIEDALAQGKQATLRREQLMAAVTSAQEAYRLGRDRYLAGATDYQTLLLVQRSLLAAQAAEIQAHVDLLTASVLLYKAIGGGWV